MPFALLLSTVVAFAVDPAARAQLTSLEVASSDEHGLVLRGRLNTTGLRPLHYVAEGTGERSYIVAFQAVDTALPEQVQIDSDWVRQIRIATTDDNVALRVDTHDTTPRHLDVHMDADGVFWARIDRRPQIGGFAGSRPWPPPQPTADRPTWADRPTAHPDTAAARPQLSTLEISALDPDSLVLRGHLTAPELRPLFYKAEGVGGATYTVQYRQAETSLPRQLPVDSDWVHGVQIAPTGEALRIRVSTHDATSGSIKVHHDPDGWFWVRVERPEKHLRAGPILCVDHPAWAERPAR